MSDHDMIASEHNSNTPTGFVASDALAQLFAVHSDNAVLLEGITHKDRQSRLRQFVDYLDWYGMHWTQPDLVAYAHWLISDGRLYIERTSEGLTTSPAPPLSPASANAHLSSIRGRYSDLLDNPVTQRQIRQFADTAYADKSVADRAALVNALMVDMRAALVPSLTKKIVVETTVQDAVDSDHIRLTSAQATALLQAPDAQTITGMRDRAMIALLLSTGLRRDELCSLNVSDLRQRAAGQLGVLVRQGKGNKQRFVPYGKMAGCLRYVDRWLRVSGISSGAVFRGFKDRYTPNKAPFDISPVAVQSRLTDRLTPRNVQKVLSGYPIPIDGTLRAVNPHDLRRTYALLSYLNGVDIIALRDNLGHADIATTQGYIGNLDMSARETPALFDMPALDN